MPEASLPHDPGQSIFFCFSLAFSWGSFGLFAHALFSQENEALVEGLSLEPHGLLSRKAPPVSLAATFAF
jgi:hypothetical protein